MEHQDYNNIVFNNQKNKKENEEKKKIHSQKVKDEESYKWEVPANLKKMIIEGRNTKKLKQMELAQQLGISVLLLQRWESGKVVPSNLEISKIEKFLNIKLPRCKKITYEE